MVEVLQKLSVKRFTATSCNRPGTPREPARDLFMLRISSSRSMCRVDLYVLAFALSLIDAMAFLDGLV